MEKKSREVVQRESLEAFKASKTRRGTICLSTGTGKSKVAIDFIKENKDIETVLITSPRTNLQENWRKELEKWGLHQDENNPQLWWDTNWTIDHLKNRKIFIQIENIQTAYKWKDKHFDLFIGDEVHTIMTPEYSQVLENNVFTWILCLTATHDMTWKNDKEFYYRKYAPIVYEYYDSANDGLINKTRFIIVNNMLSDANTFTLTTKRGTYKRGEKEYYDYLSTLLKKAEEELKKNGSREGDYFFHAISWMRDRDATIEQRSAGAKYMRAIQYRKEFLLNMPSNVKLVRLIKDGILNASSQSKVLIFSEFTDQANKITVNTIHSHKKKIANIDMLSDFNEGKIRDLGSCQSLTLGLNLKGATHAIMESYVGSATQSKQKKGRLDRLGVADVAELWIIRVPDTQNDKWFNQISKGFDLKDAEVIDSSEIFNGRYDYGKHQLGR